MAAYIACELSGAGRIPSILAKYSAALNTSQQNNRIQLSKRRIYDMLIYEVFNSETAQ